MSSTRRGARCALAAATAWAALMAAPASAQSDIPLQPFPVNHELRIDSGADARFLLAGPAGKYGFIEARDGHLYRHFGNVFRCWGVNSTGWAVGSEELTSPQHFCPFPSSLARLNPTCLTHAHP